ncbi:hypothetical protein ACFLX9_00360 [Chloroflexota bacterium]
MTTQYAQDGHIRARSATVGAPIAPLRMRGGQPGNRNARRHGFFARSLTPEEQDALSQALDLKDLVPEIALMRVKLMGLVSYRDTSPELIIKAARTLTRMVDVQHRVTFH